MNDLVCLSNAKLELSQRYNNFYSLIVYIYKQFINKPNLYSTLQDGGRVCADKFGNKQKTMLLLILFEDVKTAKAIIWNVLESDSVAYPDGHMKSRAQRHNGSDK